MKPIAIDRIKRSKEIQPRESLDDDVVDDYAYLLKKEKGKWPFPPVTLFDDGENLWLASGFHRVAAAEIAKRSSVPAEVRDGSLRDAQLFAAGTNADHGKRRTNADKRYIVQRFLEDPEWSQRSANWIAAKCKVSQPFVSAIKAELDGSSINNVINAQVETQDGRSYPSVRPKADPPPSEPVPEQASGPDEEDEIPFGKPSDAPPLVDQAAERAKKMVPELCRSIAFQLGNLGANGRFDQYLDEIREFAR